MSFVDGLNFYLPHGKIVNFLHKNIRYNGNKFYDYRSKTIEFSPKIFYLGNLDMKFLKKNKTNKRDSLRGLALPTMIVVSMKPTS